MATVVVAGHAGACFGVNRALGQVREALAHAERPVRTLGPLIHNPAVVAELEDAGARAVDAPADAVGATLVLRTHGVTPDEEDDARRLCAEVIDATCPFVTRVHQSVAELDAAGYQVVIVGEAGHPEVEGTRAHAAGTIVIGGANELADVTLGPRVGVVAQTTQTRANLRSVIDALVGAGTIRDLRVIDTICAATAERQASAAALAEHVDVMVVIGGRASANTTHLAEICAERTLTHHVESEAELVPAWFADARTVGVTAGASTPQSQIDAVVASLRSLMGEQA